MKKKIAILILVFGLGVTIRFFCGVYRHDEFPAEKYFFIKYRPTWKWSFYSPIGMSDLKMQDLTEEEQIEEKYFNEFVIDKGLSR